jgi:hypothetical protein
METDAIVRDALQALCDNPLTADFHTDLQRVLAEFQRGEVSAAELEHRRDPVSALVRMQIGGYLDERARRAPRISVVTATDYGRGTPDPAEEARLSELPPVATMLRRIREHHVRVEPASHAQAPQSSPPRGTS